MRQVEAQRAGGARFNLLYYFVSRKRTCDTHTERILLDVWDRSIHNRINRWAMVALGVSSGLETPESVERLEAFLAEFLPRVVFTEQ